MITKNNKYKLTNGVMFNAYPDSIGQNLADTVKMLQRPELKGAFSFFYILPTFFNSDLDRGFSIIDYNLNKDLVTNKDLQDFASLNIELMFDLVLNHLSVGSPQFQDLLKNGDQSPYKDFFINWNDFWQGEGEVGPEGYIIPKQEHLQKLFTRKPGLPILKLRFPDGTDRPYWNTFYQQKKGDQYLGQMDLNANAENVWSFYDETFIKLQSYGATLVRLDAFAYLHKQPGLNNFFNKPGTWEYLERLKQMAAKYDLILLPEIHSEYGQGLHEEVSQQGFPIYDFFFPGLLIHSLEQSTNKKLIQWINELITKNIKTVNMLGCHDGIPLLDLKGKTVDGIDKKGLLSDEQIDALIKIIIDRGGRVKKLIWPRWQKNLLLSSQRHLF